MAKKPKKKGGGSSLPPGLAWLGGNLGPDSWWVKAINAWGASHDPQPAKGVGQAAGAVGSAAFAGLGPQIVQGAKGIGDAIWKGGKGRAWEWVLGVAMLFVLIGSARRIGGGGNE